MAGTINIALTQQFDMDGIPLGGGLLYTFQASTTTPQNSFQDTALTIPHPNPIVLDASGRVPMFYLADGNIKIRLTNKGGVTIIAADNLLVIGPSSGGGGGGGGVDPNTVIVTGDIKARFGTGTLAGFVRCNGNTVGNAVSGATERAHADCQALFEYLWSTNVLGVFSGVTPDRGTTATGDFNGNKRIALPDLRGRTLHGLDDMGAAPANRLTSTFFGSSAIVLGNAGGSESKTLTAAQLAGHTHSGATGSENATITHNFSWSGQTSGQSNSHAHSYLQPNPPNAFMGSTASGPLGITGFTGTNTGAADSDHVHFYSGSSTTGGQNQNHQHGFTTNAGDGIAGSPHSVVNPALVLTFYIKL